MLYGRDMANPSWTLLTQCVESELLTFDTIPVDGESTGQQVQLVNPADASEYIDGVTFGLTGIRVKLTSETTGTITVRYHCGTVASPSPVSEIYKARYEFTAQNEVLSEAYRADFLPVYSGAFVTLQGSVGGMTAQVVPLCAEGNFLKKLG